MRCPPVSFLSFLSLALLSCACALSACSETHLAAVADAGPPPPSTVDAGSPVVPRDAGPPIALADAGVTIDAPPPADAGLEPDAPCPRDGETPSPELEALFVDVIRPGCVGSGRFCHGESYAFNMLSAAQMLENLVDVDGCNGIRVVPCRPEESRVSWVIRNGGDVCGRPFPVGGGRHPSMSESSYFSEADVLAIEAWIRSGAR